MAGWLTARLAQPAASGAHQLVRELGWIRLMVDALVVDQAQWRHGTGTALLEAAESWGRDRGASMVRLDTYVHSPEVGAVLRTAHGLPAAVDPLRQGAELTGLPRRRAGNAARTA